MNTIVLFTFFSMLIMTSPALCMKPQADTAATDIDTDTDHGDTICTRRCSPRASICAKTMLLLFSVVAIIKNLPDYLLIPRIIYEQEHHASNVSIAASEQAIVASTHRVPYDAADSARILARLHHLLHTSNPNSDSEYNAKIVELNKMADELGIPVEELAEKFLNIPVGVPTDLY